MIGDRYIRFKAKCLHRGYQSYGRVVAESLAVEAHLLEQLEREVTQTTANLDDFFGGGDEDDAPLPTETSTETPSPETPE